MGIKKIPLQNKSPKIRFLQHDCGFILRDRKKIKNWIVQVVATQNKVVGEIHFIFCSDNYLLALNKKFLDHDYFTDVLGFDYSFANIVSGEIFISIDRVLENAQIHKTKFPSELTRVMIHAVLHFLGFQDKTRSSAQKMRALEDDYLLLL